MKHMKDSLLRRSRLPLGGILILVAIGSLAVQPGCGEKTSIDVEQAVVESIEPTSASSGDTVTIVGTGFNSIPSSNHIVVSPCQDESSECRRLSTAFSGSTTELRGVVPDGAFTGTMMIEKDLMPGGSPVGVSPPSLSSNALPFDVSLNAGDVAKVFFSSASYGYSVDTEGADDYLLILFDNSSSADNDLCLYRLALDVAGGIAASESDERQVNAEARPEPALEAETVKRFDLGMELRRGVEEHLSRSAALTEKPLPAEEVRPSSLSSGLAPETATFHVYAVPGPDNLGDPGSYETVVADLKYEGDHTLLYVDQNTPITQLNDAEAADIGAAFEESIYAINRDAFGSESDINRDGKVAILLTPVVNDMPLQGGAVILGFFNPADVLPNLFQAVTNSMEIFYTMIPDPDLWGSDWKARCIEAIKSTIAHEFQHMILYNYRILIYGSSYFGTYEEELWLNEGLSHMAEDLNGYQRDNIARANIFLDNPGNAKLTFQQADDLQNRGAVYLFLRYLGDRYGEYIYRRLVQSRSVGMSNVERVTDEGFLELFADWSAALYLSGRGITSDPRFSYTSIDILGDFHSLYAIDYDLSWLSLDGTMKTMGPEYILFDASSQVSYELFINSLSLGSMNAVIIRLN
jgi:hypothetical protein